MKMKTEIANITKASVLALNTKIKGLFVTK